MTQLEFIQAIAPYCQKYAQKYGFKIASAAIAQACLQSGYGTSYKAKFHNYFGLKYRPNRVNCNSGTLIDGSSEQNADGSYVPITDQWYCFSTMESGVEGYYQFISISNYANVKTATTALDYLQKIKDAGYATSKKYVQNVYKVVTTWNLQQYDNFNTGGQKMAFTNSPYVVYTKISPNKSSPRNHAIDTITIHHMAGNLTIETCGNVFAPSSRQASSNYGVGTDGRIGLYVEQKDRSWCSGNGSNDHRAVTIEVANNTLAPHWTVSDQAMASLIKLCADICKRNGKNKMVWVADKNTALNRTAAPNEMRMTLHKWFQGTACPGPYLEPRMGYIADEVNKILGSNSPVIPTSAAQKLDTMPTGMTNDKFDSKRYANDYADLKKAFGYDHAKLWDHYNTLGRYENRKAYFITPSPTPTPVQPSKSKAYAVQVGAYGVKSNADNMVKILNSIGHNNIIVDLVNGLYKVQVGPYDTIIEVNGAYNKLKEQGYKGNIVQTATTTKSSFTPYLVKVNTASLNYRSGPGTNYPIKGAVKRNEIFTIIEENNEWGKLKSGAGWLSLNYTVRV